MFIDDEIIQAYESHTITKDKVEACYQVLLKRSNGGKVHFTEAKRLINGYNLAVDRLKKKHGYCVLRKTTFEELFITKSES